MSQPANMLFVELNETNGGLLQRAAYELDLPNLKRLVSLPVTRTETFDTYDSDYLEPWVQWVSIHTGVPASEHLIRHLGDVTNLRHKQIWETLSDQDISSGIWGVMNGERRAAQNCRFFVADPWTFDAEVFPKQLAGLTNFAVYIAKNYLNLAPVRMVNFAIQYGVSLLQHAGLRACLKGAQIFLEGLFRFGPRNMVLAAFYEYTSAAAFAKIRSEHNPQFCILFLNLIAHLQHHYWTSTETLSEELKYGFRVIEAIFEILFKGGAKDELLLVANGFSQMNTLHEPAWILYRPKDPQTMLRTLGIPCTRVEALMTHDAHAFFSNPTECDTAVRLLEATTVNGQKLFLVDRDPDNDCKLFYRLIFTQEVSTDAQIQCNDKTIPFFRLFENVVRRTGKHQAEGFVYQSEQLLPASCVNHKIHDYIVRHFETKLKDASRSAPVAACR